MNAAAERAAAQKAAAEKAATRILELHVGRKSLDPSFTSSHWHMKISIPGWESVGLWYGINGAAPGGGGSTNKVNIT